MVRCYRLCAFSSFVLASVIGAMGCGDVPLARSSDAALEVGSAVDGPQDGLTKDSGVGENLGGEGASEVRIQEDGMLFFVDLGGGQPDSQADSSVLPRDLGRQDALRPDSSPPCACTPGLACASTGTCVAPDTDWVQIAASEGHVLARKVDGSLWAWGINRDYRLGDGSKTAHSRPTPVAKGWKWLDVDGGQYHSIGVRADGTLWGWGDNASGQLGDGTFEARPSPAQAGADTDWIEVDAGSFHNLALKKDGTLWTWGSNSLGILGDGTTTNQPRPIQVGSNAEWKVISAGDFYSLAINSLGELWAWGQNLGGRLGDGTTTHRTQPTKIPGVWIGVAAGGQHTLAIAEQGTLWAWGHNQDGQLGDGGTVDSLVPVKIGDATGWVSVSAASEGGGRHSLALMQNGSMWAWGHNGSGELGDGTNDQRDAPTPIGTAAPWAEVQAGGAFGVGRRTDGTVWTWGANTGGTLGTGSTSATQLVPVPITTR